MRRDFLEIRTETLENRQLRLTIVVDEERSERAMRQVARQISKQVNIPGFRKGKAPYELIVQRYGEDTVRKEAAEMLVEAVYREALKEQEITPYAPGALDEVDLRPIAFNFTISLPPTVELGDYRAYRREAEKVGVDKEEVEQTIEQIREQNAILELVERPAALGDGVVIDLVGQTAEGAEFLKADELRMLLDAESTNPAPGFAEAIVGMEAGEARTFTLTLSADFAREEYRGQEAEFTVKMTGVYESTLPELDDDLARTVGNFDSLKELEQHVRDQLQQAAQGKADEEYARQVLEDILEQAQVEHPRVMLEETLDDMVKEMEQAVKQQARLALEEYLRFQGKTVEDLREELEPSAKARLKRALVLGEVVRLERLDVDKEEIGAHIEEVSTPWGVRADEVRASLKSATGQQAVRSRLLANKAVQRLVAIAKGEAPELVPAEEQEAGSEEQEAGSRTQDAGDKEQEAGSEEQEAGSRTQDAGSEMQEAGSEMQEEGSEGTREET
jgi:trigger factor